MHALGVVCAYQETYDAVLHVRIIIIMYHVSCCELYIRNYCSLKYAGCFYYTIGNIHPIFRSNLWAKQLLAVAKTCEIRTYGCSSLLYQFIEDMNLIAEVHMSNVLESK